MTKEMISIFSLWTCLFFFRNWNYCIWSAIGFFLCAFLSCLTYTCNEYRYTFLSFNFDLVRNSIRLGPGDECEGSTHRHDQVSVGMPSQWGVPVVNENHVGVVYWVICWLHVEDFIYRFQKRILPHFRHYNRFASSLPNSSFLSSNNQISMLKLSHSFPIFVWKFCIIWYILLNLISLSNHIYIKSISV